MFFFAHSFNMSPEAFHIICCIISVYTSFSSHKPRWHGRLSTWNVPTNWHEMPLRGTLSMMAVLMSNTRTSNGTRPVLSKEVIQKCLTSRTCRWWRSSAYIFAPAKTRGWWSRLVKTLTTMWSAWHPRFWGRTFSNSIHSSHRKFGSRNSWWSIRPWAIMKCGGDRTSVARREDIIGTGGIIRKGFFVVFWHWFSAVDGF